MDILGQIIEGINVSLKITWTPFPIVQYMKDEGARYIMHFDYLLLQQTKFIAIVMENFPKIMKRGCNRTGVAKNRKMASKCQFLGKNLKTNLQLRVKF